MDEDEKAMALLERLVAALELLNERVLNLEQQMCMTGEGIANTIRQVS